MFHFHDLRRYRSRAIRLYWDGQRLLSLNTNWWLATVKFLNLLAPEPQGSRTPGA